MFQCCKDEVIWIVNFKPSEQTTNVGILQWGKSLPVPNFPTDKSHGSKGLQNHSLEQDLPSKMNNTDEESYNKSHILSHGNANTPLGIQSGNETHQFRCEIELLSPWANIWTSSRIIKTLMNSAGTSWSKVIKQAVGKHRRDPPTSSENRKSETDNTDEDAS